MHDKSGVHALCCIVYDLDYNHRRLQEKCYQYWPSERSVRYDTFIVEPITEYNMPQYILREFKVTDTIDNGSRTVRQFQFTDWPEQGVPKSAEGFIDFIGQVHKTKEQFGQEGPITVHCRYTYYYVLMLSARRPVARSYRKTTSTVSATTELNLKMSCFYFAQWRCGQNGRVHIIEHRVGTHAMRGCNRSLPNNPDSANAASSNGSNRGRQRHHTSPIQ